VSQSHTNKAKKTEEIQRIRVVHSKARNGLKIFIDNFSGPVEQSLCVWTLTLELLRRHLHAGLS